MGLAVEAENRQRGGQHRKMSAESDRCADPPCEQRPREVSVADDHHRSITQVLHEIGDHTVHTVTHLLR